MLIGYFRNRSIFVCYWILLITVAASSYLQHLRKSESYITKLSFAVTCSHSSHHSLYDLHSLHLTSFEDLNAVYSDILVDDNSLATPWCHCLLMCHRRHHIQSVTHDSADTWNFSSVLWHIHSLLLRHSDEKNPKIMNYV